MNASSSPGGRAGPVSANSSCVRTGCRAATTTGARPRAGVARGLRRPRTGAVAGSSPPVAARGGAVPPRAGWPKRIHYGYTAPKSGRGLAGTNRLTPVFLGSPKWARTTDLRINSPSLYRLSYRGTALNYSRSAPPRSTTTTRRQRDSAGTRHAGIAPRNTTPAVAAGPIVVNSPAARRSSGAGARRVASRGSPSIRRPARGGSRQCRSARPASARGRRCRCRRSRPQSAARRR